MRAVNRDMIALYDRVLEFEGRHASDDELLLVHSEEYLEKVKGWSLQAAEAGKSIEVGPGVIVSEASWDAARAATGSVLSAIDAVMEGRATNAFCPVRPPGAQVLADAPGVYGLLNSVAVAARYLSSRHGVSSVVVVEWTSASSSALAALVGRDPQVHVGSVGAAKDNQAPVETGRWRSLPASASGSDFCAALNELVEEMETTIKPGFILLAAGMDVLRGDPIGGLDVAPVDLHDATRILMDWAEDSCHGRLVSVLEGGYDAPALGTGVVQHLRALTELEPAS